MTEQFETEGRLGGRLMPDTREMHPRKREMPHSRLRRLRLHTIHHLDGRSIAARRAKAVVRDLVQALGATATPMQLQAIGSASSARTNVQQRLTWR